MERSTLDNLIEIIAYFSSVNTRLRLINCCKEWYNRLNTNKKVWSDMIKLCFKYNGIFYPNWLNAVKKIPKFYYNIHVEEMSIELLFMLIDEESASIGYLRCFDNSMYLRTLKGSEFEFKKQFQSFTLNGKKMTKDEILYKIERLNI